MACNRFCTSINHNNTIVVTGLCEDKQGVSNIISNFNYWKEDRIREIISIPDVSPNIEEVNSVNIIAKILNSKVIKTPKSSEAMVNGNTIISTNLEGKKVTGRKIIIEGQLCQIIEYTTSDPYDNVRSMTVYKPFASYIVVPEYLNINGENIDALLLNFEVNVCIEDVEVNVLNCRSISKITDILFYAIPNA